MGRLHHRRGSDAAVLAVQSMLRQGLDPVMVAFILRSHNLNPGLIHFLTGPMILHHSLAKEELPDWLPKAVYMDRLEKIMHEHAADIVGETATLADAVAYLFSAAASRNPGAAWQPEWVRIYGYISYQVLTKYDLGLPAADAGGLQEFRRLQLTRRERDKLLCPLLQCIRERIVTKGRLAIFSTINDDITIESYAERRSVPSFRQLAQRLNGEIGRPDVVVEPVISVLLRPQEE